MPDFFDFHTHPSFKQYYSDIEFNEKDSVWKTYRNIVGIIKSQASIEQMNEGGMKIAVNAIYSMEKAFSAAFLIRHLAPVITPLDEEMIASLPTTNYVDHIYEEIRFLEQFAGQSPNGQRSFQILNSINELDDSKLNIILAIEGGHSLEHRNKTMLQSLIDLKRGPHRFLYLTLAHFIQFDLCTHAYGMKLIKKNDVLKPLGSGLTDLGRSIIDRAYLSDDDENRIFIDVKHMSLNTRKTFYQYRADKGYQNIPILATHVGFTGISYEAESIKAYIKKQKVTTNGRYAEVIYEKKRPQGIGKSLFSGGNGKTHFKPLVH